MYKECRENYLDSVDKKILSNLEYDPRITLKKLAKSCHLSKDAIKYRINKLEKEKIILGYTSFIDYKKLGNQSYKIYIKINANLEKKERFREFLKKHKNVFAIFESNGNWNFGVAIFAKDHLEYNEIENSIFENFGDLITNITFCSMIDAEIFQKDFFNLNKPHKTFKFWGSIDFQKLDEIDKKIIKIINQNSVTSLVDLSEKIDLSIDAIKKRIKKLEEQKIIIFYKTKINYSLLGFDQYKMFIFPKNYSNEAENQIMNFLRNNKNCINIIRTIGPWKIEAEFLVKNIYDMDNIINEINEKFQKEIRDLEFSLIKNEEIFPNKDLLLD